MKTPPKTLPPDPDGKNDDRAAWAEAAIQAFLSVCRTDKEDAIADLICDLGHLCDRDPEFGDFQAAIRRGLDHYFAETEPLEGEDA